MEKHKISVNKSSGLCIMLSLHITSQNNSRNLHPSSSKSQRNNISPLPNIYCNIFPKDFLDIKLDSSHTQRC